MSQNNILTVTELTARIKQTLEQGFAHIEVLGEVSRLTKASSGHVYFTIKDSHASLSAVLWRTSAVRMKQQPKEGQMFTFKGHISLYEPRGTYQMVVTHIAPVGVGALAAAFEEQKKYFLQKGWFAQERKKVLPSLPKHIGIVTSPTAAAWEDVKKIFQSRPAWLTLSLSPCLVQGSQAASSIAHAIRRFQHLNQRPDVILLVRGGGSMEDLWCFNDEAVVQSIVESNIPIISGIGHEIDTTLADFASDCRAATPSNAAEISCPSKQTLQQRLPSPRRLKQSFFQHIQQQSQKLKYHRQSLLHTRQTYMDKHLQHCEQLQRNLHQSSHAYFHHQHAIVRQAQHALMPLEPSRQLHKKQKTLQHFNDRLTNSYTTIIPKRLETIHLHKNNIQHSWHDYLAKSYHQIQLYTGKLHAIDPKHVLKRGYSLTTDDHGQLLSSAHSIQKGDHVHIHFHDGYVKSHVQSVSLKAKNNEEQ